MNIEAELVCIIDAELEKVKESKEKIKKYLEELNKYNPFKIGDTLVGNDYAHFGKDFVVESTCTEFGFMHTTKGLSFAARGPVTLKNGKSGTYRTMRSVSVETLK